MDANDRIDFALSVLTPHDPWADFPAHLVVGANPVERVEFNVDAARFVAVSYRSGPWEIYWVDETGLENHIGWAVPRTALYYHVVRALRAQREE